MGVGRAGGLAGSLTRFQGEGGARGRALVMHDMFTEHVLSARSCEARTGDMDESFQSTGGELIIKELMT